MAYHLYDNNRRHLAMSESLVDIESVALDVLTQESCPYGFIRWTEPGGQKKEIAVTPESLAAKSRERVTQYRQVRNDQRMDAQRAAHRRATWLTNAMVGFLLLYLASEITSILMQHAAN